jgi:hypothetical protein
MWFEGKWRMACRDRGQVSGPCRIVHSPFPLEGCRLFQHGIHRGVIQSLARRPTEAVFFPCVFSGGRVCLFSCFPPESAFRIIARRPPGLGMSLSCGFRAGRMELLVSSVLLRRGDNKRSGPPDSSAHDADVYYPCDEGVANAFRPRGEGSPPDTYVGLRLVCPVDRVVGVLSVWGSAWLPLWQWFGLVWFVDSSLALRYARSEL